MITFMWIRQCIVDYAAGLINKPKFELSCIIGGFIGVILDIAMLCLVVLFVKLVINSIEDIKKYTKQRRMESIIQCPGGYYKK